MYNGNLPIINNITDKYRLDYDSENPIINIHGNVIYKSNINFLYNKDIINNNYIFNNNNLNIEINSKYICLNKNTINNIRTFGRNLSRNNDLQYNIRNYDIHSEIFNYYNKDLIFLNKINFIPNYLQFIPNNLQYEISNNKLITDGNNAIISIDNFNFNVFNNTLLNRTVYNIIESNNDRLVLDKHNVVYNYDSENYNDDNTVTRYTLTKKPIGTKFPYLEFKIYDEIQSIKINFNSYFLKEKINNNITAIYIVLDNSFIQMNNDEYLYSIDFDLSFAEQNLTNNFYFHYITTDNSGNFGLDYSLDNNIEYGIYTYIYIRDRLKAYNKGDISYNINKYINYNSNGYFKFNQNILSTENRFIDEIYKTFLLLDYSSNLCYDLNTNDSSNININFTGYCYEETYYSNNSYYNNCLIFLLDNNKWFQILFTSKNIETRNSIYYKLYRNTDNNIRYIIFYNVQELYNCEININNLLITVLINDNIFNNIDLELNSENKNINKIIFSTKDNLYNYNEYNLLINSDINKKIIQKDMQK